MPTEAVTDLLLARGRDRLETFSTPFSRIVTQILSYSLGDAIDWKLYKALQSDQVTRTISYSLGDAIDWKLGDSTSFVVGRCVSYSLGDAIDWKRNVSLEGDSFSVCLLLARGRDRLETTNSSYSVEVIISSPTR